MIRRKRLQNLAPKDEKEWQKQYYTHQKHWQRKRLLALRAIWDGKNLADVCREHKIGRPALVSWLDKYLHGGYKKLLSRNEGHRPQLLSEQRQRIVRYMMLHKTPADYGIDSYQWTANFMQLVVKNKWQIEISAARLYQLFHQWGLSVQKVHRDYGPTDPQAQAEFIKDIKKKTAELNEHEALIALDEFALQNTPYTNYAWAEKNTKPRVWSDERHRKKLNAFLTVDVQRGDTRIDFNKQCNSEEVAAVVVLTVLVFLKQGLNKLTFLLDNARTHGNKMKKRVNELLAEMALPEYSVNYWHTPKYSPNLNPAEYIIHAVRRNGLYNVPCTLSVEEKAARIQKQLARGSPMSDKQMRNLIDFIARTKVKRF